MKKRDFIILSCMLLFILVLVIALYTINNSGRNIASEQADIEFTEELHAIAEDTFDYFLDFTNPETGLTYDLIRLRDGDIREKGRHTSPTNIGMYF